MMVTDSLWPGRISRSVLLGIILLLVCLVVARVVAWETRLGYLALSAGVLSLLVIYRPAVGVIALLFLSVLVPVGFLIPGMTTWLYVPELLIPVLTGLLIVRRLVIERRALRLTRPMLPLAFMLLVATVSGYGALESGMYIDRMDIFYGAYLILAPLAAYFFTTNAIEDRRWLRPAMISILSLGSMEAGLAILSRFLDQELSLFMSKQPVAYATVQGGFAGVLMVVATCIAVAVALGADRHPSVRALTAPVIVLLLFGQVAVYVRGAWVATVVGCIVVTWLCRRTMMWGTAAALVIVASLVVMVIGPEIPDSLVDILYIGSPSQLASTKLRVDLAQEALKITASRPWVGVGPGTYLYHAGVFWQGRVITSAHNNYAQIAAELGILGLLGFLGFLGASSREGWELYRNAVALEDQLVSVAFLASLISLAVMALTGDYILNAYSNTGLMCFRAAVVFWILLGLVSAARRLEAAERGKT